jgi:hypothetical protein
VIHLIKGESLKSMEHATKKSAASASYRYAEIRVIVPSDLIPGCNGKKSVMLDGLGISGI